MQQPCIDFSSNLPDGFQNNPYSFYQHKKKLDERQEKEIKWYELANAKQRYEDYPKIKRQRNIATIVAIVGLVATIVLGILQLKCK